MILGRGLAGTSNTPASLALGNDRVGEKRYSEAEGILSVLGACAFVGGYSERSHSSENLLDYGAGN